MPSSLNLKMKMSVNGTSSPDWEMNKNKRHNIFKIYINSIYINLIFLLIFLNLYWYYNFFIHLNHYSFFKINLF